MCREFVLHIYSQFRKLSYPICMKPTMDGWQATLHGETIKSTRGGLRIMQHLCCVEGLEIDTNMETAFEGAWKALSNGENYGTIWQQLNEIMWHLSGLEEVEHAST